MKTTYEEIAELIAERLTERVSTRDLAEYYHDRMVEYCQDDATDDELVELAVDLGIIGKDETLEFVPETNT
jgi:hypothetical protein